MSQSFHTLYFINSQDIKEIEDETVNLSVTSCPYPMIEMWDEVFSKQNPDIKISLENNNGELAFELMHRELDKVWNEMYRVLKTNGIACINIGDATRRIGNDFSLYPSHSRIISHCLKLGFKCLPFIIWTKLTNVPNKFLGSGMLPPGAYVTLEHEYILILRKGGKREFKTENERKLRSDSSYFWEERNKWFSDMWDLKGVHQSLKENNTRKRSAAFPFELAYRLISMYSLKGDLVLDPFIGTGTTMLAAIALERNSIGIEIEESFRTIIEKRIGGIIELANDFNCKRIQEHIDFIKEYTKKHGDPKHKNTKYGFPVKTKQEITFSLNELKEVKKIGLNSYQVQYED